MSEPVHVFIKNAVIDVTRLTPDQVDILYIARTLSRINRFGGHTRYPYSVAQHAVLVSYLAPKKWAYEGLHHDDTEAFIGDVINPIKSQHVRDIEAMVRVGLRVPLRLLPFEPSEVKAADLAALYIEQEILQGRATMPALPMGRVESVRHAMQLVRQMHPLRAEEMYLERHQELTRAL